MRGGGGRRHPAPSDPRRAPWAIAACLFAIVLAAYLANARVMPSSGDDVPSRLIPFSLLGWGTPALDPFRAQLLARSVNPFFLLRRGGHLLSLYPPGAAIVALPVYVPYWLWLYAHGHTDAPYLFQASAKAGKLAAAVLAAASVAVLFLLLARRLPAGMAALVALAFGLATGMWVVSSQLLWQHGPGVLCILLGMACLAPGARFLAWRAAGAGFFLGAAAAVRPQNAVFLLAGGVLCAWEPRGRPEKVRPLLAFAAGGILPVAATLAYNERYLGAALGGYGVRVGADWFALSALPAGLAGLLLSPNRGLLWFSPIALVGIWGMVLAFRRRRSEAWLACFSAAAVLYLLVHAAYRQWTGGGSFGPRYLTETLPVLALAASLVVPRLTPCGRWAAAALLCWSVLVEIDGAVCHPASMWDTRMTPETARRAWDLGHWMLAEDLRTWVARRGTPAPPPAAPLPPAAFRVEWLRMTWWPGDARPALCPKMQARALVTFRNASDRAWPDAAATDPARSGAYAVRLAWRWRHGSEMTPYGERRDLREPLAPGAVTTLRTVVIAPPAPGDYVLQLDLVQEGVAWFADRGAGRFLVPLHVEPAGRSPETSPPVSIKRRP